LLSLHMERCQVVIFPRHYAQECQVGVVNQSLPVGTKWGCPKSLARPFGQSETVGADQERLLSLIKTQRHHQLTRNCDGSRRLDILRDHRKFSADGNRISQSGARRRLMEAKI